MTALTRTNPERITALEVEVGFLRNAINDNQREHSAEIKALNDTITAQNAKLDSLLELKAKGMGAVWLASGVIGIAVYFFISWLKGDV